MANDGLRPIGPILRPRWGLEVKRAYAPQASPWAFSGRPFGAPVYGLSVSGSQHSTSTRYDPSFSSLGCAGRRMLENSARFPLLHWRWVPHLI
jgi:hypothetical protein